jgi:predicted SprT family Zn-dependent metalloprotease
MAEELTTLGTMQQARLDEALRRISARTPVAATMTVAAGRIDGVARLVGGHITVNADWIDDQTDATLDFVLRHEACHHAVEMLAVDETVTYH